MVKQRKINVKVGHYQDIEIPANWKDAEGVLASHKETNSIFTQRDYKLFCKTGTEPLMIVEGYWLWWCKTHHQPLSYCVAGREKSEQNESNIPRPEGTPSARGIVSLKDK